MARLLKSYLRVLDRHPLVTQALTTGVLMSAGDVISQVVVEKKTFTEYGIKRTARFFIFGTFFLGPALRKWYGFLDATIKKPAFGGVLAKIALDQLFFAPALLCIILGTMTAWSTYSLDAAVSKINRDYKDVLITNYKIWPAAQVINFYFVPLQHRILYVGTVALFWNVYLSYKTSN